MYQQRKRITSVSKQVVKEKERPPDFDMMRIMREVVTDIYACPGVKANPFGCGCKPAKAVCSHRIAGCLRGALLLQTTPYDAMI